MQSKFGSKASSTNSNSHDNPKLMFHTNHVIRNRASILRAAQSVCPSLSARAEAAIPKRELGARTKRGDVVDIMLKIYQALFELFQCDTFDLSVKVESDIEVFLDILEGVAHECTADIEREKEKKVSDKLGKSIALSSKKMQRKYLEGGGKRLSRNDGGDCTVKACPKCGLDMFDKEPDYDANKRRTPFGVGWRILSFTLNP